MQVFVLNTFQFFLILQAHATAADASLKVENLSGKGGHTPWNSAADQKGGTNKISMATKETQSDTIYSKPRSLDENALSDPPDANDEYYYTTTTTTYYYYDEVVSKQTLEAELYPDASSGSENVDLDKESTVDELYQELELLLAEDDDNSENETATVADLSDSSNEESVEETDDNLNGRAKSPKYPKSSNSKTYSPTRNYDPGAKCPTVKIGRKKSNKNNTKSQKYSYNSNQPTRSPTYGGNAPSPQIDQDCEPVECDALNCPRPLSDDDGNSPPFPSPGPPPPAFPQASSPVSPEGIDTNNDPSSLNCVALDCPRPLNPTKE
jgi:hypothetical protein